MNSEIHYLLFLYLLISGYNFGDSRHKLSEMTKFRKFGKLISPDSEFDYELNIRGII